MAGGGRGIRTPGPRERTTVFKTAAFDHSAIPPGAKVVKIWDRMAERRGFWEGVWCSLGGGWSDIRLYTVKS
jgi:hypothetical protein